MKTHFARDECALMADLVDGRRSCQPHIARGQRTEAFQRAAGTMMVVVAVVAASSSEIFTTYHLAKCGGLNRRPVPHAGRGTGARTKTPTGDMRRVQGHDHRRKHTGKIGQFIAAGDHFVRR